MTAAAKPRTDDKQLDKTLEDTFPASDAPSGNVIEGKATRRQDRQPAQIDEAAVEKAAEEARRKLGRA